MSKRTAIYCRVSTKEQTTENQKRDLIRYCEQRDLKIIQVFEDQGISGTKQNRPALDDMMAKARNGEFDTVLVWKFDRFARSTKHIISALEEFQGLNIDFISFNEGIDTSTSVGKMVFTFLGAIAQFERSLIVERTMAGLNRARAEGKHCGRPKVQFDYNMATKLRAQGFGFKKIAKMLDVSVGTVFSYFKRLELSNS